jgi:nitronate monooxygenase
MMRDSLLQRLTLTTPIIQAPMAGGGDTPALVAAVSNSGGLGSIGATYSTVAQIHELAREVRAQTTRPFAINLFAPVASDDPGGQVDAALARLAPYYDELGVELPRQLPPPAWKFDEQLAAAMESGAAVFSFTFGLLPAAAMEAAKSRMFVIGTATTVAEAVALARSGVDAIVAQGSEAGGHRGSFAVPFEQAMVGTMALVPQIVDAVDVPVIASGGIMDGRGIAAALALGASAAQLGTAFLTSEEAGIADVYKEAILAAGEHETRITRAFSGRPARGIVNRFMSDIDASGTALPFPYQNALTRPLRQAAARQGRADMLSLWAGQGVRLARRERAADLMTRIMAELGEAGLQVEKWKTGKVEK